MNVKMINIIKELVTPYNYDKESTDYIAIQAYTKYGTNVSTTSAITIVLGLHSIPKWSTVVRRIQMTKKSMKLKVLKNTKEVE